MLKLFSSRGYVKILHKDARLDLENEKYAFVLAKYAFVLARYAFV